MSKDRAELKAAFAAALASNAPAAALVPVVPDYFPDLRAFRENDDLVILAGETRRLLVRRIGPDSYRASENAAASGSTNLLDFGGGTDRDLDGLIDEIAGFAAI